MGAETAMTPATISVTALCSSYVTETSRAAVIKSPAGTSTANQLPYQQNSYN